jgi:hypothetical protein
MRNPELRKSFKTVCMNNTVLFEFILPVQQKGIYLTMHVFAKRKFKNRAEVFLWHKDITQSNSNQDPDPDQCDHVLLELSFLVCLFFAAFFPRYHWQR